MDVFKKLLFGLGGLILVLLGLTIVVKQVFGVVIPAISILIEVFGGVDLVGVGIMLLRKIMTNDNS